MDRPSDPSAVSPGRGTRLDSWKEIAAYLNRDIRTVQRWEKTADLPVRRLQKPGLRAVFAYSLDLDEWLEKQAGSLPAIDTNEQTESEPDPEPLAATPDPAPPPAPNRSRVSLAVLLCAAAIVAGSALYLKFRTPSSFGPLTSRPITSDPGSERDPDISPDGKYVAYSYVAPNLATRILIRLIDGASEPRAITTAPANEWSPVWSPDGTQIAFLRGEPGLEVSLHLTSALGSGAERQVVAGLKPYPRRRTLLIGHLLAWMPGGRHIIAPDRRPNPTQGSLFLINVETGEKTRITTPDDAQYDVEPSVSSDGRTLVFNRVRGEYLSDVFVQKLDANGHPDGQPRKLPPAGKWNGTPRFLENRGEVLVCAGNLPRLSLWRQPLDGSGPAISLGIIGDYATQSAVHNKSGRIISRTYRSQADILRYALPPQAGREPSPAIDPPIESLLESTFIDRNPIYSPDGSQIAFISDRTGQRQIWVSSASGANPVEWTQKFEVDLGAPAWSPDGSKLVFAGEGPAGPSQLYVADRKSRTAVLMTHDDLDYGRAVFSHDGNWIYTGAADKSVYSIYKLPASPSGAATTPEKIISGYTYVAGSAPDGRGLYIGRAISRNKAVIEFLSLPPRPDHPPVHIADVNFSDDCWVTNEGVFYLARREDRPLAPVALRFRTHSGSVDRLLQNYSKLPGRGLSISADGRYALTMRVVPPISDLLLLDSAPGNR